MSRTSTLRKQTRSKAKQANKAVGPVAADARDTAVRYAGTTRDWAAPHVEAAKDWAGPKVEPAIDKVKSDVLPAVAGAVTAALAASEPVRSEAASRGTAAFAALKGEVAPPKKKKHRVRKLFLLASVLGAAYAGWKAWVAQNTSSDPAEAWSSPTTTSAAGSPTGTVTPVSTVTPVPTAGRPTTDDPAGAGPDEALADAADEAAAGDPAPTVVEPVTPKNAKKASTAASKSKAGTTSTSDTPGS
jgi:hypothetical protein